MVVQSNPGYTEHADLARQAQAQWRWRSAISYWDKCIATVPDDKAWAIAGKAYCLVEVGQINAARELFTAIADRPEGLAGLAQIATIQDPPHIIGQCWDRCAAEFPDVPTGMLGKSNLLLDREAYDEADVLLAHVIMSWPDCVEAGVLRARCATAAKKWKLAGERWTALLAAHPKADSVRVGTIRYLAAIGDQSETTAFLAAIEDEPIPFAKCVLEYHVARDDFGAAAVAARKLVDLDRESVPHRFQQAQLLMRHGSPETLHAAVWILRELYELCEEGIWIKVQLIEACIRSRLEQQARDLIRSIPGEDRRQEVEVVRGWLLDRDRCHTEAKQTWDGILERSYFAAVHAPIGDFARVDKSDVVVQPGDILLMSVVRNEAPRLEWFLSYYRKLGVDKFIIVDNASTDDTLGLLINTPDTILYRTTDRYSAAGAGMRWINEMIDRHGRRNWCLHVDVDEAFVFPAHETLGLRGLVDYLDRNGDDAVLAPMLDMYPREMPPLSPRPETEDWASSFVYFDGDLSAQGFAVCPYVEHFGGVRRRLLDGYQLLNKVPLINAAAGIRFLLSSHRITPAKVSDVTAALLHYHLVYLLRPEFRALFDEAVTRREFPSNALERLRSRERLPAIAQRGSLLCDRSIRYQSGLQLVELGLVRTDDQFLQYARASAASAIDGHCREVRL